MSTDASKPSGSCPSQPYAPGLPSRGLDDKEDPGDPAYLTSHDKEDLVAAIDGRPETVDEVAITRSRNRGDVEASVIIYLLYSAWSYGPGDSTTIWPSQTAPRSPYLSSGFALPLNTSSLPG